MTILTNHLNINHNADPGYWYLLCTDFRNAFLFLYQALQNNLDNPHNIDTNPPPPGNISTLMTYFFTLELYMKTFLRAKKGHQNMSIN